MKLQISDMLLRVIKIITPKVNTAIEIYYSRHEFAFSTTCHLGMCAPQYILFSQCSIGLLLGIYAIARPIPLYCAK